MKKRKISLVEFRKIKDWLLRPRSHIDTHQDFVADYNGALTLLKQKRARKMQIVRFKQLVRKAQKEGKMNFNRYAGD